MAFIVGRWNAEVVACLEEVQLSNKWIRKPTVIKFDCHNVVINSLISNVETELTSLIL